MANDIQVTIGSITFNDTSSDDFYLIVNTPELLSSLSTRQTKTSKQGEHGVHDSLSFYDERMLPFEGEIHAADQAARKTMENALKSTLALPAFQDYAGDDGYMLVEITDEDGNEMQCYAKIVDPPRFSVIDNTDPGRRRFTFVLMAKDPILYGVTLNEEEGDEQVDGTSFEVVEGESPEVPFELYQVATPSVMCDNEGTIGAPPVITVTGPTDGPIIRNQTTGLTIDLDGLELLAGESVTIDVAAKTVEKNDGTDLSPYFTGDWWVLAPGENSIALLDDTGDALDATLTVQWRNPWI
jgi:phage-related protein